MLSDDERAASERTDLNPFERYVQQKYLTPLGLQLSDVSIPFEAKQRLEKEWLTVADEGQSTSELVWRGFDEFDAVPGDVVLRRWKSRESGKLRYALIECWKTISDYLPGSEFMVIDDGLSSDAGLRAMDYWSR